MSVTKDLGGVTAYAAAVSAGYTGTKEDFEALLASVADSQPAVSSSVQTGGMGYQKPAGWQPIPALPEFRFSPSTDYDDSGLYGYRIGRSIDPAFTYNIVFDGVAYAVTGQLLDSTIHFGEDVCNNGGDFGDLPFAIRGDEIFTQTKGPHTVSAAIAAQTLTGWSSYGDAYTLPVNPTSYGWACAAWRRSSAYRVTWDGVVYENVKVTEYDDNIVLGADWYEGGESFDTYPFALYIDPTRFLFNAFAAADGPHTVYIEEAVDTTAAVGPEYLYDFVIRLPCDETDDQPVLVHGDLEKVCAKIAAAQPISGKVYWAGNYNGWFYEDYVITRLTGGFYGALYVQMDVGFFVNARQTTTVRNAAGSGTTNVYTWPLAGRRRIDWDRYGLTVTSVA